MPDPLEIEQRHIQVKRTARYAIIGSPGTETREVWIVCHGFGQLAARFIRRFQSIANAGRVIVAPEALSRFYTERAPGEHSAQSQVGATWMTSEDRESEIADYVAYLDDVRTEIFSRVNRADVSFRALGFSQGTATVARWIAKGKAEPDQVILWAGGLPPELTQSEVARLSRRSPLLFVIPKRDEYISRAKVAAELMRVKSLDVRHDVIEFDGGHDIDVPTLEAIARVKPAG
jgi:predicted esterase